MLCTKDFEISGTMNHTPPYKCNCSSTVGTVLGYTCSIIGKPWVDKNTGSLAVRRPENSVSCGSQAPSWKPTLPLLNVFRKARIPKWPTVCQVEPLMFHFLSYNQGRPGGELLFGNGGQHHIRAGRDEQGSKVKEGGGSLAFCLTGFLLSCGTLALRSEWNPCATSTVIFF